MKPIIVHTAQPYDKVVIEDSPTSLTRMLLTVGEDPAIEGSEAYTTTVMMEEDDVRALVYALNRWLGRDQG